MHVIFLMWCKSFNNYWKASFEDNEREDFGDVFVYSLFLIQWCSDVSVEELFSLFPFYRDDFADSHREKHLN